MKCIPAIDLLDGGVVRLLKGDYAQVTHYPLPPRAYAERVRDAGLDTLHVVDLNAARGDTEDNERIVVELAGIEGLVVQVGGGVRNEQRLLRMLEAGASRVVVGSVAAENPDCVMRWMELFGPERIVPALDVRVTAGAEPEVLVQGWQEASGRRLWPLLEQYRAAGLQAMLCTDVSRDGTLSGPNVELYRDILRAVDDVEVQASGGVGGIDDLRTLASAGLPAAIIGRAWLDERITLDAIRSI